MQLVLHTDCVLGDGSMAQSNQNRVQWIVKVDMLGMLVSRFRR